MSKTCPQETRKANQSDRYICNPITGNWIKIGSATHISLIKNGVLQTIGAPAGTVAGTKTETMFSPLKLKQKPVKNYTYRPARTTIM